MSYSETSKISKCLNPRFLDKVKVPSLLYSGGGAFQASPIYSLCNSVEYARSSLDVLLFIFLCVHVRSMGLG